jgi:hypothetical protein
VEKYRNPRATEGESIYIFIIIDILGKQKGDWCKTPPSYANIYDSIYHTIGAIEFEHLMSKA